MIWCYYGNNQQSIVFKKGYTMNKTDELTIVLGGCNASYGEVVLKTISLNNNLPVAYSQQQVVLPYVVSFGTIGKYEPLPAKRLGSSTETQWVPVEPRANTDLHAYYTKYQIVVVVKVSPDNNVTVYNKNIGERTLYADNRLKKYHYEIQPQVGHRLLLECRDKTDNYDILRNITLEKLKWEMDQHII